MNWDDLKYFLAVARHGSVRSAAQALDVNHATVSRRIRHFEQALGLRLFERTARGYEKTHHAEEIYQEALHLEERLSAVSRKLAGKDKQLSGDIRITLHEGLLQQYLMDDLAAFSAQHPGIELEIIDSSRALNLSNREADIALRFCQQPPEHLVGRKLASIHRACYYAANRIEELKAADWQKKTNWLSWSDTLRRPVGQIARDYPRFRPRHKIMNVSLQVAACRAGMGVGILPCFIGDSDPQLLRIAPYTSEHKYDLWLLYHPDLRSSVKIRTLVKFLYARMEQHRGLFEGEAFSTAD
ncbi:DNA-binding transcriptional regulator, LysR family [Alteromonadaceae bacterium Bs31]|nr:DNA-binding transcriptional regulator, LysR family [Alteromonadaceae bacterium Bs31]